MLVQKGPIFEVVLKALTYWVQNYVQGYLEYIEQLFKWWPKFAVLSNSVYLKKCSPERLYQNNVGQTKLISMQQTTYHGNSTCVPVGVLEKDHYLRL